MNSTRKQIAAMLYCILLMAYSLQAQNFYMVKDVNNSKDGSPTNSNVFYSIGYNSPFAVLNNVAYFAANDGINGNEVWRSDGTSAGTYMLKNIDGTAKSSSPSKFVTSGKYVYFIGSDSIHGAELWRTNGMPAGTVLVKDLMPGTGNSGLGYFTDINGTLFFSATTPSAGNELMKSNGTGAGTVVVKDVVPGNGYSSVNAICNVNGKAVYYYATGIDSLSGLYASDGTAAGTIRLTGGDIVMGSNTSAAVGNKFFFMGVDHEPWVSDGTPQGTHLIKAINPAAGSYPLNFTDVNGIAYFTATDQTHGTELWRSDGMDAGTYLVKDITPGKDSSDLSLFTAAGNTVFFLVTNTAGNTDLWKSDGTSGGTLMIKSFGTGNLPPVQNLAVINGILYFDAYTAGKGYEMWRSDGSTTGTVLVKDIYSGIYSSYASGFTGLNNKILFSATDGINGNELWTSDGTVGNASLLKDINQSSTSDGALYWGITPFKNKIYFIAYTPQNGNELWVTNGAEGNTTRVTDIQPGSLSGLKTTISQFHTSSGRLYFEAANLKYGNELWSTDGDSSKIVKDITPGREGTTLPEQYFPGNKKTFGNIDSTVLFVTGAGGTQLWKTKANSAVLLTQGTGISGLTTNKNIVYFSMYHNELWKTDGTVLNTVKINNAVLASSDGSIPSIISYKNRIFFASGDHTMWVTDGTSSGTKLFKNINPQFDAPSNFVSATNALLHNILFFAASDGITGMELWKTDGTAKGTAIVKDIQPGAGSAFTDEYKTGYFIKASQLIYFLADDGTHGTELWKTDGTTIGTIIVKDITPGSASTQISSLTAVGDKVAFLVYDPASKKEILWQSDGTENGTQPVNDSKLADITFTDYFNNLLVGYNNKLYFTAYMPGYGYELWAGKLNDSLNRSIMLSGNLINDNDAQLRWHTGDEIDADHFDIERSEDGVHFANIGSVTKNINGESNTGYSYLDKNISLKGRVYYRLHTIKGNGSKTISNVVLLSSTADVQLMVLPNPVESNFTVQVILQKGQQVQLQILNAQGTIMLSDHKSMNKGNNTVQYNAGLWRAGIYTLRLLLNNESVKELIIIKQ